MEPHNERRPSAGPRHLRVLAAGLFVLGIVAMACHPLDWHVDSVHSADDYETSCVDLEVGQPPPVFEQVGDTIVFVLTDPLNVDLDWDGLPKINFIFHYDDCDTLDETAREAYEIEYLVVDFTVIVDKCGLGAVACARPDRDTGQPHGDHTDYGKVLIYLNFDHVLEDDGSEYCSARCKHVINHETGHALGLDDSLEGRADGPGDYEHCTVIYEGMEVWNVSIMHDTGYCPPQVVVGPLPPQDLPWPTAFDMEFAKFVGDW